MEVKISGGSVIKDIDEKPIVMRQSESGVVYATMFEMIRMCLLTDHAELDRSESGEDKFKRWQLARRAVDGEFEVSVEEAALIKRRSAVIHSTTVYGRLCDAIEGT